MLSPLVQSLKDRLHPYKRRLIIRWIVAKSTARNAWLAATIPTRRSILRARLGRFLAQGRTIEWPRPAQPEGSILLVVEGDAELTLAFLEALPGWIPDSAELVIIDNGSTDRTRALLARLTGPKVVRNDVRVPIAEALRQAARESVGPHLLFVEADGRLEPGSLEAALETLRSGEDVGVVGGMTIRPNGKIEEAGSILWREGTHRPHGEGLRPTDPQVMFRRDADFCSGAFFLTDRARYLEFASNRPASTETDPGAGALFERVDYSLTLRESEIRTIYDPRAVAHRWIRSPKDPRALTRVHERIGRELGPRLGSKMSSTNANLFLARNQSGAPYRVLHFDDRVPYPTLGAGFPRTQSLVASMVNLGYFVTYYPVRGLAEEWSNVYRCLDRRVEVMLRPPEIDVDDFLYGGIAKFLDDRHGSYDVIVISRPINMEYLRPILDAKGPAHWPRIVYDAEALFCVREIEELRVKGEEPSAERQRAMIEKEIRLVDGCSAVLSVSDREARNFQEHGFPNVFTLSHCIDPVPTPNPFEARAGMLFVGAIHSKTTPNADSISWFLEQVLPKIREWIGADALFTQAGSVTVPEYLKLGGAGVNFAGKVDDLTPLYNASRIFVAPTRFAAGIPLKCIEAAAHGVPIVVTRLLAHQLGWVEDVEILVADDAASFASECARLLGDPELWARLRTNALRRIEAEYSVASFAATVQRVIGNSPADLKESSGLGPPS